MLTDNIIQCSKENEKVTDSKILLENRMLIQTIESTKKKISQKGSKKYKKRKKKRMKKN
jgi:hypothetical protein